MRCPTCGQLSPSSEPHEAEFDTTLCPSTLRLSKTNDPPPQHDEALIREQLRAVVENLHLTNSKIDRMEEELTRLRAHRDAMLSFEIAHKNILFPARRLPSEIVAEIMLHAQFERESTPERRIRTSPLDVTSGLWVYGRVCSHWRAVISSHPTFWSNIDISRFDLGPSAPAVLAAVLERSDTLPLNIDFNATRYQFKFPKSSVQVILDILLLHSHRWKDVKFSRLPKSLLPSFSLLAARQSPLLESLYLLPDEHCTIFGADPIATIFENSPQLHSVTLRSMGNTSAMRLPWSQLTEYIVDGYEPENFDLLQWMPHIQHFSVPLVGAPPPGTAMLRLPHLKRLDASVLRHIEVPALEELTIAYLDILSDLPNFILRSSCSLRTLTLLGSIELSASMHVVGTHLFSIPTLTNLSVHVEGAAARLLPALLTCPVDSRSRCLLPNLQQLSLTVCGLGRSHTLPMVQLVQSRWDVPERQRARVVRLDGFHLAGTAAGESWAERAGIEVLLDPIDHLRDEGMDVRIDLAVWH